jgi:hypothetical protein
MMLCHDHLAHAACPSHAWWVLGLESPLLGAMAVVMGALWACSLQQLASVLLSLLNGPVSTLLELP